MIKVFIHSVCSAILLCSVSHLDAAFPGIFPILSTGWYYKPGPVESMVLGLLVVKILAIRLGATLYGVPYHLNDIFDEKKLLFWNSRGRRSLNAGYNGTIPLTISEFKVIERILLSLKRIDSHDCFIRYICEIHQKDMIGESKSVVDDTWVEVFKLRRIKSSSQKDANDTQESKITIWDIYEDALSPLRTNCTEKYRSCPLPLYNLGLDTISSGIF